MSSMSLKFSIHCEVVLMKSRYGMEAGYVRFYLAPKIGDEE